MSQWRIASANNPSASVGQNQSPPTTHTHDNHHFNLASSQRFPNLWRTVEPAPTLSASRGITTARPSQQSAYRHVHTQMHSIATRLLACLRADGLLAGIFLCVARSPLNPPLQVQRISQSEMRKWPQNAKVGRVRANQSSVLTNEVTFSCFSAKTARFCAAQTPQTGKPVAIQSIYKAKSPADASLARDPRFTYPTQN